ncbi:GntR family transcriptional regulator [Streptomyces phaeochromogenes]|uniref:GntR family transcriptional regulator n=1 Tax=Streptomyces phaeochromogenes TaxID=1923 RepID=UPI00367EC10F
MSGEGAVDGGGREFERVSDELRARMADGVYPLGTLLPPQRVLAKEFGVSRDTVQRVLRELSNEGWIETRQGSGSRVMKVQRIHSLGSRTIRPAQAVTLRSFINDAFEAPEVTLDVYTLTSESLDAHIRMQAERIRDHEISPQRIALRMLLPSEELKLPYPTTKGASDDPRLQDRLHEITQRHSASLKGALRVLRTDRLVPTVDIEIRRVPIAPTFKLYLLNGSEALHGPYEVIERTIELDDGEEVVALDVLGLGATLTHYEKDDDPNATGTVFVGGMQSWFDSIWTRLAQREDRP